MATPDANGNATVTVSGAGPAHVVTVDVRDPAGNGGPLSPM
jgi:hypothetical protein